MEQLMKCLLWKYPCKFEALIGMIDIEEGNNIEAIIAGMTDAKSRTEKENQFVYYCIPVTVDYMMYSHAWHGKPNDAQLKTH
jgi:transketolase